MPLVRRQTWLHNVASVVFLVTASSQFATTRAGAQPPADVACRQSVHSLLDDSLSWAQIVQSSGGIGWYDCVVSRDTGATPLHELASRASPSHTTVSSGIIAALTQKFVAGGARVLTPNDQNNTALHVAAHHGATAVAVGLCGAAAARGQLPALLAAEDAVGRTAMIVANANGQAGVALVLLRWGASAGGSGGSSSNSPSDGEWCQGVLIDAVLKGDPSEVRDVIASPDGGSPDCLIAGQDNGYTLLHYAALSAAHLEEAGAGAAVIQVLLDFGANASRPDEAEELPLMAAARGGERDVVEKLFEAAPSSITAQSGFGRTALHVAASNGGEAMVRYLLEKGSPVDVVDSFGFTALDLAQRAGYSEVASLISIATADPTGYYAARRENPGGTHSQTIFSSSGATPAPPPPPNITVKETVAASRSEGSIDPMTMLAVAAGLGLGFALVVVLAVVLHNRQGAKSVLVAELPDNHLEDLEAHCVKQPAENKQNLRLLAGKPDGPIALQDAAQTPSSPGHVEDSSSEKAGVMKSEPVVVVACSPRPA